MKKGDPVGEFLGRLVARILRLSPEEEAGAAKVQARIDDWAAKYLRLTREPPEMWKSVLLWVILGLGLFFWWLVRR